MSNVELGNELGRFVNRHKEKGNLNKLKIISDIKKLPENEIEKIIRIAEKNIHHLNTSPKEYLQSYFGIIEDVKNEVKNKF